MLASCEVALLEGFLIPPRKRNYRPRIQSKSHSQIKASIELKSGASGDTLIFDSVSTVNALSSCAASQNLELGSCLHAAILKSGLCRNVYVSNSLLGMYTKCGSVEEAEKLFDKMPDRTVVTWTSMISGYSHNGEFDRAISLFILMLEEICPNEFVLAAVLQACGKRAYSRLIQSIHGYILKTGQFSDGFLQNSMLDVYAKCGHLSYAEKLLERCSCRDVVSWTSVVSGCVLNGLLEEALMIFVRMLEDGVLPNEVTILTILHACSLINKRREICWVHGLIIKMGWCGNDLVMNSLVEMYIVNGHYKEGMSLFRRFCFSGEGHYLTAETMATLLQGCGLAEYMNLGKQMHGYLIKHGFFPCIVVENSLMDMYAESGDIDSSNRIFVRMKERDIVSWNAMINCHLKNDEPYQALMLLKDTHSTEGDLMQPDFITLLASIQACSNLASFQLGQVIHGYITKGGLIGDMFIQNALIDFYGRSGNLAMAEKIFNEMPVKDLRSWNSLIIAYGVNGDGKTAIRVFHELKRSGIQKPNAITYVNTLAACVHAGLVKEGCEIFEHMKNDEIDPGMEHYVCMVDLLGRSGRLTEAEEFIEKMPVQPTSSVWGALLGACALYGEVYIAEIAAKQLRILDPYSKVWRVALSNVYAGVGRWDQAAKVRAEMKGLNIGKEGGWSSVEIGVDTVRFMVNDTRHSESELIYEALSTLMEHMIYESCI